VTEAVGENLFGGENKINQNLRCMKRRSRNNLLQFLGEDNSLHDSQKLGKKEEFRLALQTYNFVAK
jgi:hypothetical protein